MYKEIKLCMRKLNLRNELCWAHKKKVKKNFFKKKKLKNKEKLKEKKKQKKKH